MSERLKNKNAIVTAAGQGIGKAGAGLGTVLEAPVPERGALATRKVYLV